MVFRVTFAIAEALIAFVFLFDLLQLFDLLHELVYILCNPDLMLFVSQNSKF